MEYGKRIIFDPSNGRVLNYCLEEMSGNLQEGLRPESIDFIDLPYGDTTLRDVDAYHVDVQTRTVVVDSYREHTLTYEELQQQLLIAQGVI
ncbi:conserved hypothetical protein [Desulfitobacterium hafniense DCB-2]|nr:hypothetical protein [Desulfitobacterium hafniense]ACL19483.1 conserved hypothetical protein [Desulfitobacterium hafniense DCB-2]ACL22812.1 conserved hypothetical protein [Desulfitobacterium hafniense DCB-2]